MSWSLKLRRGDLVLGGSSLAAVTGSDKLVQDLRCALLEPLGSDSAHPDYGSTLDGGTANGQYQSGPIGMIDPEAAKNLVEAEIRRVARAHQQQQVTRVSLDKSRYGTSTLSGDELLREIRSIDVIQVQDTLIVRVLLGIGNTETTLDVPISTLT